MKSRLERIGAFTAACMAVLGLLGIAVWIFR